MILAMNYKKIIRMKIINIKHYKIKINLKITQNYLKPISNKILQNPAKKKLDKQLIQKNLKIMKI